MFEKDLKVEKRWFHPCRINGCRCGIAILAAIAMPQFLSAADRARNAKRNGRYSNYKNATQLYMIDKNVDTPPTVENLYKEGYLTEHVKTAKGKEYTITYEAVSGGTAKAVVVTAPSKNP